MGIYITRKWMLNDIDINIMGTYIDICVYGTPPQKKKMELLTVHGHSIGPSTLQLTATLGPPAPVPRAEWAFIMARHRHLAEQLFYVHLVIMLWQSNSQWRAQRMPWWLSKFALWLDHSWTLPGLFAVCICERFHQLSDDFWHMGVSENWQYTPRGFSKWGIPSHHHAFQ